MTREKLSSGDEKFIMSLDNELSKRFIALDPSGYCLVKIDYESKELIVEHYSNEIDSKGRAVDSETGEILGCAGSTREPVHTYRGMSAKQVGIQLTEGPEPSPLSKLDHALYIGRELQRAEQCLRSGKKYIQD